MLLRRAGLTASAGLSCTYLLCVLDIVLLETIVQLISLWFQCLPCVDRRKPFRRQWVRSGLRRPWNCVAGHSSWSVLVSCCCVACNKSDCAVSHTLYFSTDCFTLWLVIAGSSVQEIGTLRKCGLSCMPKCLCGQTHGCQSKALVCTVGIAVTDCIDKCFFWDRMPSLSLD